MSWFFCCCHPSYPCAAGNDDFSRADNDDINNDWVSNVGHGIRSNRLENISGTTATSMWHVSGPQIGQYARAKFYDIVDGAIFRIIVNAVEPNTPTKPLLNYHYGEWEIYDDGELKCRVKLVHVSGGSASVCKTLDPSPLPDEGMEGGVSITEKRQFCMQGPSSLITVCSEPHARGYYAGLQSVQLGQAFDDWEVERDEDDGGNRCGNCDCTCEDSDDGDDGWCIPDGLLATYTEVNKCPDLDGWTQELINSREIKYGTEWLSKSELCPSVHGPYEILLSWLCDTMSFNAGASTFWGAPIFISCNPFIVVFFQDAGVVSHDPGGPYYETDCCGGLATGDDADPPDHSTFLITITAPSTVDC